MYLPLVKCWWALILKEFLLLCLFVYWICFIMLFKGSHLHKKKSDKFCETYSIFCNSLPIHLTSLQLGGEAEIRAWLSEVGTFSQVSMTIFTQIILPFQIWRWLPLGAGRGGRKTQTGKRNRVLVYILFNSSDIAGNVPGLSVDVKEFCLTNDCLKVFMRKYFDGDRRYIPNDWCCSNCNWIKTILI